MIPGSDVVEKKVLNRVVPSSMDERRLHQVIDNLFLRVKEELVTYSDIDIEPVLVGSIAKETYLWDSLDVDLFLVFPGTVSEKELEVIGLSVGRKVLTDKEECFAQHPYVRGMFEGFKTEIVPCYQISDASEKRSAVDRTPLHTKYVVEHLGADQHTEVRLFKQFLKGVGCYGAEAVIEGFSGYLCELIILYYGTFQKTIEEGSEWKQGVPLRLDTGETPFFDTPLVFIDPVDSERNVASALVREKFDLFVKACQAYRGKPGVLFFFPHSVKPWTLDAIQKKLGDRNVIGVEFQRPDIIPENLYPQLRKATSAITDAALSQGFNSDDTTYYMTDERVGVILFPRETVLSSTVLHMGPPTHLKRNTREFLDKWRGHERAIRPPFEQDGRWYVEIQRKYTSIVSLLDAVVPSLSLGKHMSGKAAQDYTIRHRDALITEALRGFWTAFLDTRMPWER